MTSPQTWKLWLTHQKWPDCPKVMQFSNEWKLLSFWQILGSPQQPHWQYAMCAWGKLPQRGRSMALKSRGLLGTAHLVCNFFASRFARFFKTILQVFPIPKTRKAGQRWPYMSCASWRTIRTSNQDACKIQIQLESARHFEYFWVMLIRCHPISDSLCVPCVSSSPRCRCGSGASQWTCHGVHAWPGFLSPRFWQIPECLAKKLEMPKWIRKSGTHAKLCTTWQKIQNIEKMKHCRLFHIFHIYIYR